MRNATSIWLFGASSRVLALGACGGGGSGSGRDDGSSGSTSTAGSSSTAGTLNSTAGSVNSTAGNTSSAGSAGTSAGGAGSCNPVAGSKKGDGTNKVIDELDDMNTMFAPAGSMATGTWDWGKDTAATAMGSITPAGTMTLMPVTGGHMGNALHVTGTGITGWGAALAAFLNGPMGAFDASDYGGVAFWIKGTTTVQEGSNKLMIQARMPDVLPGLGTCCDDKVLGSECYSGHRTVIDVPADWAEVKIAWSDFKGPAWGLGSTLPFNANRVRDINFSFNHDTMGTTAIAFDVWVDGLRFLSKDEMSNVTGGSGGSSAGGSAGSSSGGSGGAAAGSGGGGAGGTGGQP
jgi:hypothetical protein